MHITPNAIVVGNYYTIIDIALKLHGFQINVYMYTQSTYRAIKLTVQYSNL